MVINTFFRVWLILAKNNLQNQLLTPSASLLFILGKFFNFIFAVLTIFAIFQQTRAVQGYQLPQAVIVVIIFNLIDSLTQFLFRSLYTFRPALIKGDFDLDLLKPLPSFFRPIFSGPDFLDLPMIIFELSALIYFLNHYSLSPSLFTFFVYLLSFIFALIIAFSIHLIIAAFAVITTEIDSLVLIYRALSRSAVVPIDIYQGVFRFILSYVIPIAAIMTVPAQALLGILTPSSILYSSLLSFIFLLSSLYFWKFSLRRYTSASS